MKVIGYIRVSKDDPKGNGASPEAQRAAIAAEADRRGWEVRWVEDLGFSGRNLNRPGIRGALADLATGKAQGLVVSRLDRLSRSMLDFPRLIELAKKGGWALVVSDLNVDTTTPEGEMFANNMATFAQYERRLIGQRTKAALAVKKAQGVRLGRPPATPPEVLRKIKRLRNTGLSHAAIADRLNAAATPTPPGHGGSRWHPRTVGKLLSRMDPEKQGFTHTPAPTPTSAHPTSPKNHRNRKGG